MNLIEPSLLYTRNWDNFYSVIKILEAMGFNSAFVEIRQDQKYSEIHETINKHKEQLDKLNFKLYLRKTLDDKGQKKDNKHQIEQWRTKCLFISQRCSTPDITKWATLDQRVDSLEFHPKQIHLLLDLSTARMMSQNQKFLELNIFDYLNRGRDEIGNLRNLMKALIRVRKKEVPILINTSATTVYQLVNKFTLKGFLSFLDIEAHYYFDYSQTRLANRIEENLLKLDRKFIAPGVSYLQDSP